MEIVWQFHFNYIQPNDRHRRRSSRWSLKIKSNCADDDGRRTEKRIRIRGIGQIITLNYNLEMNAKSKNSCETAIEKQIFFWFAWFYHMRLIWDQLYVGLVKPRHALQTQSKNRVQRFNVNLYTTKQIQWSSWSRWTIGKEQSCWLFSLIKRIGKQFAKMTTIRTNKALAMIDRPIEERQLLIEKQIAKFYTHFTSFVWYVYVNVMMSAIATENIEFACMASNWRESKLRQDAWKWWRTSVETLCPAREAQSRNTRL